MPYKDLEKHKQNMRENYIKNREYRLAKAKQNYIKNRSKKIEYSRNYYKNNKKKCLIRNSIWRKNNNDKMKSYKRKWSNSDKGLKYKRKWRKENPRSNTHYPDNIRNAMNLARIRDNNKCKWFNCKNNKYNSSIHAHHIFPKSEYPELADKTEYIICYCEEHHRLWHSKRWESNRTPKIMTREQSIKARKVYYNHVHVQ